jgi:hypothetical protein
VKTKKEIMAAYQQQLAAAKISENISAQHQRHGGGM